MGTRWRRRVQRVAGATLAAGLALGAAACSAEPEIEAQAPVSTAAPVPAGEPHERGAPVVIEGMVDKVVDVNILLVGGAEGRVLVVRQDSAPVVVAGDRVRVTGRFETFLADDLSRLHRVVVDRRRTAHLEGSRCVVAGDVVLLTGAGVHETSAA